MSWVREASSEVQIRLETIKLELEREKTKQLQLNHADSRSRTPSGLHTPKTPRHGRSVRGQAMQRSPGHYFDELKKHFSVHNSLDRFGITLTKYACNIYDGKESVYACDCETESMRNLYIMMSVSEYSVERFLEKLGNAEFGADFLNGKGTPDKCLERSNVYAPVLGK